MRRSDPFTDFVGNTLSSIDSNWGKLVYMNELRRTGGGRYAHWGMTYYYGEERAQRTMSDAHYQLVRTLLTLRVSEVIAELRLFADLKGISMQEGFREMSDEWVQLVPELTPAEHQHIKVTWSTVEALLARSDALVS
jgi:hypothetical protein